MVIAATPIAPTVQEDSVIIINNVPETPYASADSAPQAAEIPAQNSIPAPSETTAPDETSRTQQTASSETAITPTTTTNTTDTSSVAVTEEPITQVPAATTTTGVATGSLSTPIGSSEEATALTEQSTPTTVATSALDQADTTQQTDSSQIEATPATTAGTTDDTTNTSNVAVTKEPDTQTASSTTSTTDVTSATIATTAIVSKEIAFVNSDVYEYQSIVDDIHQNSTPERSIEVVVVNADQDGIEQVSAVLADRSGLSAVHFITHGSEGQINLGNTWLSSEVLAMNQNAITAWGKALTDSGDVLFYGCDIAAGSAGENLLKQIADLTGADVTASSDETGAATKGGDWVLEFSTGAIEAPLAISTTEQQLWQGLLAANNPPSFSIGTGMVTTAIGSGDDVAYSTVLQADGKILLSGISYNGSDYDFALIRYNSDGSLDTGFGTGGKVTTAIGAGDDYCYDVAIQADGKIVATGYSMGGKDKLIAVVRYNVDGSLDTSFNTTGMVTTDIGSADDQAAGIVIQDDGKIVVAGSTATALGNNYVGVVRYNTDGSLDTTFNSTGIVTTAVNTFSDFGTAITLQTDGKILVGGFGYGDTSLDYIVVRYNTDGSLDATFNGTGTATTSVGAGNDIANSIKVQSDGKIVLAGYSEVGGTNVFSMVRYDTNGLLDTTFNSTGKIITAVGGGNDIANSVAIQDDGKILLAGKSTDITEDFAVVRYTADGSLDTTFNGTGKVVTPIGADNDYCNSIVLQEDGRIIAAGSSINSNIDFTVVRYNTDGSLDLSFNAATSTLDGAPTFTENGAAVVLDADVQIYDPELYVAGSYSDATLTLARNGGTNSEDVFSATGTLASLTEGGALVVGGTTIGTVTTNSGGTLLLTFNASATNALVNAAMQQIAYANSSDGPPASVQIDWTFSDGNTGSQGAGGALTTIGSTTVAITAVNDAPSATNLSSPETYTENTPFHPTSIVVSDPDNDPVTVTLTLSDTTAGSLSTATSGSVTSTFAGGVWTATGNIADVNSLLARLIFTPATNYNSSFTIATSVNDGIAAALTGSKTFTGTAVNDAPTFSVGNGIVTTDISTSSDSAYILAQQADGKIVVAGSSFNGSDIDFSLVRYNSDGSLDTSFNLTGMVTTDFGSSNDCVYGLVVQADGKILVSGSTFNGSISKFALARYNSDGSLDTTFNSTGLLTTDFGYGTNVSNALAVQDDGKILATGYSNNGAQISFATARYNSDGSLDTTFNSTGMVTTSIGTTNDATSITLQTDGKILIGGHATVGGIDDLAVVRYNTDGSLDTTFNSTGIVTTAIGTSTYSGYSIKVQADGKIVFGGHSNINGNYDCTIVRYNTDGSLDTTFNSTGIVTTDISTGDDYVYSIALQADGKILAAGYSISADFFSTVVRYNTDGSLDTTFNSTGMVTTDVCTGFDVFNAIAIQNDGKIIAAGSAVIATDSDFTLVRYNTDGSLDLTFNKALTLDGTPAFIEGGSAVVLDADVQVFDPELSADDNFNGTTLTLIRSGGANSQDVFSATGTLSTLTEGGALVVGGTTIGTVTTNSGGTLLLTFNASATNALVNSAMQKIAYSNASDNPPASVQIDWIFNDGNTGSQGIGGPLATTGSTTVSITAVNDAPTVATTTNSYSATTNVALKLQGTGLSVGDVDAGNAIVTVTISTDSGTLGTNPGTTGIGLSMTSFNAIYVTGTIAQINDFLAGNLGASLSFIGSTSGITTLILEIADGGNTGTGGQLTATTTVIINVNDAPTATNLNAPETYIEDIPLDLTDIVVTDTDSAAITVTLTLSDTAAGNLSTGTSGAVTATFAGGVWTASGAIADVNTLLAGLTFTPTANYNGDFNIGTSVSDGLVEITGIKTVTGTPINDAPTATNLSTPETYTKDTSLILTNIVVGDIDSSIVTVTLTLSDTAAGNLSTGTSGAVTATFASGVWTASGAIADVNALLAGLTFTPTANYSGDFSIGTSVSDGLAVVAGTKTITETQINKAPTSGPVTLTAIAEDSPAITISQADLLVAASDVDGDALTATNLSIASGNGTLVDNHDGTWSYTPAANDDTSVRFSFSISDGTTSITAEAALDITPVNDAPTGSVTLLGALAAGQSLTADTSTVADADGLGPFTYQWLRNGVAIIGATGSTYTLTTLDVNAPVSVQVSYTDGGGTEEHLISATRTLTATGGGNDNNQPSGTGGTDGGGNTVVPPTLPDNPAIVPPVTQIVLQPQDELAPNSGTQNNDPKPADPVPVAEYRPDPPAVQEAPSAPVAPAISAGTVSTRILHFQNLGMEGYSTRSDRYLPVPVTTATSKPTNFHTSIASFSRISSTASPTVEAGATPADDNLVIAQQVEELRKTINKSFTETEHHNMVMLYVASGFGASLSLGFASYVLRFGALLSSLITSAPLWNSFDPIPILARWRKKRETNEESEPHNEPLAMAVTDRKMETMFTQEERH